jgi:hypothetical protein
LQEFAGTIDVNGLALTFCCSLADLHGADHLDLEEPQATHELEGRGIRLERRIAVQQFNQCLKHFAAGVYISAVHRFARFENFIAIRRLRQEGLARHSISC